MSELEKIIKMLEQIEKNIVYLHWKIEQLSKINELIEIIYRIDELTKIDW